MVEKELRRLQAKWGAGTGWPQRLDWLEISGIRGWQGQRFSLQFPIMAIVGENGVGKSTLLQAAASVYRSPVPGVSSRFASGFFPDTPWDRITDAEIRYAVREGSIEHQQAIRKPTERWLGNPDRRQRAVEYIDLSRIQPVPARVGYIKLANRSYAEVEFDAFEQGRLGRFCSILGRPYDEVKMATTDADPNRAVPVTSSNGSVYSGFHQGAGETTLVELLQNDLPKYSLVLIDEIESSLHPRMQRRLIRDLAEVCRQRELQIVLTTHSPYVLDELPSEARVQVLWSDGKREMVYGVSPEFAMSRMDDVAHYECDLYVEDERAATLVTEILAHHAPDLVRRCQLVPYGAASVGKSLGQMSAGGKFPRPSCVFIDGDAGAAPGCVVLPGDDAPEVVVFEALAKVGWAEVHLRTGREYADVADACSRAMTQPNLHVWVREAASDLVLGGDTLWQAMCAEWSRKCLTDEDVRPTVQAVEDTLAGLGVGTGGGTAGSSAGSAVSESDSEDVPGGEENLVDPDPTPSLDGEEPQPATLFDGL